MCLQSGKADAARNKHIWESTHLEARFGKSPLGAMRAATSLSRRIRAQADNYNSVSGAFHRAHDEQFIGPDVETYEQTQ